MFRTNCLVLERKKRKRKTGIDNIYYIPINTTLFLAGGVAA
jgi:hypothetical protein